MPTSEDRTPETTSDPLDRPANRATVEYLYRTGYLSAEARGAALAILRTPRAWWLWANRLLLFLGSTLILAGVIFFFAYNWARIGAFQKFALIQAGLLGCLIATQAVGLDRLAGRALLLSAGLLVGVFLAVHGQVYQTGADSCELFAGWALLIFGWVAVSKFGAFWLMWLGLVNVGVILWWAQSAHPGNATSMFILLALLNAAALAGREYAARRGVDWLSFRWLRWVLLPSVLVYLTIPTVAWIARESPAERWMPIAAVLWALAIGGAYLFFRFVAADLLSLTFCALSVCAVALTFIGDKLFGVLDDAEGFLLFGLIVVGVFSAAAFWLRRIGQAMEGGRHG